MTLLSQYEIVFQEKVILRTIKLTLGKTQKKMKL
jgi:hypothetical protein